ncbi:Envelope protein US9 [Caprine alphaherpesvirus 1]|uniref:Envelope protein US9 n=1 Tax=Caprine alphaherpesvirus 1 TaxID=39944 RepID=A0AAE5YIG5_9ALPH|nr:Envelope protein US9 [Caprine alphaherpesvirus 1]QBM10911.1 Envelope protein US9 [Caprine alphaherpesvirus 1]
MTSAHCAVNENYQGAGASADADAPGLPSGAVVSLPIVELTIDDRPPSPRPNGYAPVPTSPPRESPGPPAAARGGGPDARCYYSESDSETAGEFLMRMGRQQRRKHRRRRCAVTAALVCVICGACAASAAAGAVLALSLGR